MTNVEFSILLIAMALASYGCRVAGFVAMRFVTITPRIEAACAQPHSRSWQESWRSRPCAAARRNGSPPSVLVIMKLTGQDVLSALLGVVIIALARWAGL